MIATAAAGETSAASGTATTTGGMTTDQRKPLATTILKTEEATAPTAVSTDLGATHLVVVVAVATITDSPTLALLLGLRISRISSLEATSRGSCRPP